MEPLLTVVRRHLIANSWRPERVENGLRAPIEGYNGVWYLRVTANEDDRWLICHSLLPFPIPAEFRNRAALLITRFNDSLILGNFEIDFADGQVAYKTSMRLTEQPLDDTLLKDMLMGNFGSFDRMIPAFYALVYTRASIRRALRIGGRPLEAAPTPAAPSRLENPPEEGDAP